MSHAHRSRHKSLKIPVQVSFKRFLYISSQIFLVTQEYFRYLPPNTVKTHSVNLPPGNVARLNINLQINGLCAATLEQKVTLHGRRRPAAAISDTKWWCGKVCKQKEAAGGGVTPPGDDVDSGGW